MNTLCAVPEQYPAERRRNYPVLLTVLLASLLLVALILFPLITRSPSRRLMSFDWSGYSVASDLNNPQPEVTSINASWTVPEIKVSTEDAYCAVWIGVGGQFENTLIQAGTEQDSINGRGKYSAWYELLPDQAVTIDSLGVSAGDRISASISLSNPTANTWSIEIHDVTDGQSFQKSLIYASSMLSAEWILERPTVNNRVSTLANFGEITFTGCTATMDSRVGTISSFASIQLIMYNRQNIALVSVSPFASNDSLFTVNFRASR
jgi:hypothetical protein